MSLGQFHSPAACGCYRPNQSKLSTAIRYFDSVPDTNKETPDVWLRKISFLVFGWGADKCRVVDCGTEPLPYFSVLVVVVGPSRKYKVSMNVSALQFSWLTSVLLKFLDCSWTVSCLTLGTKKSPMISLLIFPVGLGNGLSFKHQGYRGTV